MPKDPWKNQPNYKIGGGQLNEYDFNQSHGELSKEEADPFAQQGLENPAQGEGEAAPQSPQEAEAERIRQVIETAHEKAQRGRKGGTATVSGVQPAEGG
ncbi:MAG TPA: hypothetical protein VIP46_07430, partial [Pyrinomonadaceae bacterium]